MDSRDLQEMFNNEDFYPDYTVRFGDTVLHLNKSILAKSSSYFRSSLRNKQSIESQSGESDFSQSEYLPVVECMFRYIYTFPLQVQDGHLGLLYSAFRYFGVKDEDVRDLVAERISQVDLNAFHDIICAMIVHEGQDYFEEMEQILMGEVQERVTVSAGEFFDNFDYGNLFLWKAIFEIMRDQGWFDETEKHDLCEKILREMIECEEVGPNDKLVQQVISALGDVSESILLLVSKYDLNDEAKRYFVEHVTNHIGELEVSCVESLSFFSSGSSVSRIEFLKLKDQIQTQQDQIQTQQDQIQTQQDQIQTQQDHITTLEAQIQTLTLLINPIIEERERERQERERQERERQERERQANQRVCRVCKNPFDKRNPSGCRYHNGRNQHDDFFGDWDHDDKWSCCGEYYFKVKEGHERNSNNDLEIVNGSYVVDHSTACSIRDHVE